MRLILDGRWWECRRGVLVDAGDIGDRFIRGCVGERSIGLLVVGYAVRRLRRAPVSFCGCAIECGERLCAVAHLQAAWLWRWRFSFWFFVCETDHGIFPYRHRSNSDGYVCKLVPPSVVSRAQGRR